MPNFNLVIIMFFFILALGLVYFIMKKEYMEKFEKKIIIDQSGNKYGSIDQSGNTYVG